jgi:predicted GNAT superfamily acetyltransferase
MDEAVRIRTARDHADFQSCVRLQREVWGLCDLEITSAVQLVATVHAGGLLLLAEDASGEAVGFAYAFAGLAGGEPYLHSDMLAVRPGARGHGVGRRLKWAQREEALRRGLRLVQWTFDPMRAPNARLNLRHLGATAREYRPDLYGRTSSALHLGLPTDRLLARWELDSARVRSLAAGAPPLAAAVAGGAARTIEIPADWDETATDPARAADEQSRVRQAFEEAFAAGYEAVDFDGDPSGRCFYLLRPRTPPTGRGNDLAGRQKPR